MAVYGALFGMALGLALGGAAAVVLFEEMDVEVTVPVARFAIVGLVAAVAMLVAAVLPRSPGRADERPRGGRLGLTRPASTRRRREPDQAPGPALGDAAQRHLDAALEAVDVVRGTCLEAVQTGCHHPWRPRQDSNLRSRLRRAVLYPLSYGGHCDVWTSRPPTVAHR